jgi:gas vesicle structural protein
LTIPPTSNRPPSAIPHHSGELAIADLLDRALSKGLVLWGEATISVAGIDLVYLGVKVLVASTDTANRMWRAAQGQSGPPDDGASHGAA